MKNDLVQFAAFLLVLIVGAAAEDLLPHFLGVGFPLLLAALLVLAPRLKPMNLIAFAIAAGAMEDALAVLARVGKDEAVLADVYHTYRGSGSFATFRRLRPDQLPVLHVNDYPLTRPRVELVDADRVWPGDGAAPWGEILGAIDGAGLEPWLSIEVFNPSYWRSTPVATMREGVRKAEGV